jgi:hypothetical protein
MSQRERVGRIVMTVGWVVVSVGCIVVLLLRL